VHFVSCGAGRDLSGAFTAAVGPAKLCNSGRCCALDFFTYLIFGLSQLLLAQASVPHAPADREPAAESTPARDKLHTSDGSFPWFVILSSPPDIAALWQSIDRPDLVVIKESQLVNKEARDGLSGADRALRPRGVVESVLVRGAVGQAFAELKVELAIDVKGAEALWVPIRLDGKTLTRAREAGLELALRRGDRAVWEVELQGEGEHRILVELRASLGAAAARRSLSLSIPEAARTAVALEFADGESDIVIGANEASIPYDRAGGKKAHLSAHLSPRSRLDVSWTGNRDAGVANPPLLTAQGEMAIDIDDEHVRTRSSWAIRCMRGATRSLELRMNEDDEVTELMIDDQSVDSGFERVRGTGKLMVRLGDPLQAGATLRLVMKTSRPLAGAGARRVSFVGFPFAGAREQSGFIGITQSANLWVTAATSEGVRKVDIGKLPADLRTRPSTSMAFEFLDQPFRLDLGVEPSPPLVRADSKTIFRIASERARSETTIELGWVRGRLTDVELGVPPGLELTSVGPADVVESSHLSDMIAARDPGATIRERRLRIRLTSPGRDANKVTLKLTGLQRIAPEGKVKLGVFTPIQAASAHASFTLVADRGLALALADDSGRIRVSSEFPPATNKLEGAGQWGTLQEDLDPSPLWLVDDDNSRLLDVNITRHARTLVQETLLSAKVSKGWIDLIERSTIGVRHGVLLSLEILVPAEIVDRWEMLDKELADREELGPEPGGGRRYRLMFPRPIVDKLTLRFRYRLNLISPLDAMTAREVTIPSISLREVPPGPTKVEMSLAPEIVLKGTVQGWIQSSGDSRAEPTGEGAILSFTESEPSDRGRPFEFQAIALPPVALPSLVVPRLLLKMVANDDEAIHTSATYWVEAHGPDFAFALPDAARWIGARIDGRSAEHVDYDPAHGGYRLRFPGEFGSKSVLVELQYEQGGRGVAATWQAPRLSDGGALLQTLWELRLPSSLALVGVPRGWSDENQWAWSGFMWTRRPRRDTTAVNEWIGGAQALARAVDEFDGTVPDDHDRYLFSRSGPPAALSFSVASRSWLVAICSGATLFFGFLAIFSKIRFRTTWLGIAGLTFLAAVLVQPSVMFLALESALLGLMLTMVGLVIELLIERIRSRSVRARPVAVPTSRPVPDSSLNLRPSVGSDDSTAIRVRPSSTLDFVPAEIAAPQALDDPRTPSLEGT
jgi:hypothetical protein